MRVPARRRAVRAAALTAVTLLGVVLAAVTDPPERRWQPVSAPTPPAASPSEAAASPPAAPPPTEPPPPVVTSRLLVPGVGLDVPLLPLTPEGGVIDPPTYGDAYWVEPYGDPGPDPDNTLYVAAHSWTGGDAAFNALMDGGDGSPAIGAGDAVEVRTPHGATSYAVVGTARYDKDELPVASDVWAVVPGRLVLITCFVDDAGRATDENLVVFADVR